MLSHPHYPSPRTTALASLVKGEVLSPERIRATTGGIAFLPHPFRFSGTSVNNPSIVGSASHCNRSSPLHKGAKGDSALPALPKPHYPLPRTTTLASLVKGRWLDGKPQTVALLRFACIQPPFLFTKLFAVKTEGLVYHPSLSTTSMPPLSKVRCCRPKEFGRLPEGLLHHPSHNYNKPLITLPNDDN